MKLHWSEDEDGALWFRPPYANQRERGEWTTCQRCGVNFPTRRHRKAITCSQVCGRQHSTAATRHDLFVEWTPAECWLAGLIWADGNLHNQGRGRLRVSVALIDEDAVRQAAQITGGTVTCWNDPRPPRKPMWRTVIGNREAVERLTAKGLDERKSLTTSWPEMRYPDAFLAGAFDGDGSVVWYQPGGRRKNPNGPLRLHTTLVGSHAFLVGARDYLAERHQIEPRTINEHGSIHRLQWNHRDSLRLRVVLYAEPGPRLARKRERFFQHPD